MKIQDLKPQDCIHCPTEPEAEAICKLMHEAGMKWCSGASYLDETKWAYAPTTGIYYRMDGTWEDRKGHGLTIYPASLFLTPEKECIGWKWKEKYRYLTEVAATIANCNALYVSQIIKEKKIIELLRAAGVLELWFDKVYKPTYSVGDWVITEGYHKKYDGKPLHISRFDGHYVYFDNGHKADAPPYALAILSFTTRNGKTDIDIVHRY